MSLQQIPDGGLGANPPSRWAIFWDFFEKIPILMPLDHISHVLAPFEKIIF